MNFYKLHMKLVRSCVFCQSKGMSKEHFWPNWVGPFLKKHKENNFTSELYTGLGKNPMELKKKRAQPGNLFTKKMRVVCKSCNNGWMSRLEAEAKPILLSILEGKSFRFDSSVQETLAKWIVMKVIVSEHSEEEKAVTPEADANEFFRTQKIPSYFRIFIGYHNSSSDSAYIRHSMTLAVSRSGPNPPLAGRYGNTQSISFLLGPLCVHVLASRIEGVDLGGFFTFTTLRQIWPRETNSFNWPVETVTTPEILKSVANCLNLLVGSPTVKAVNL